MVMSKEKMPHIGKILRKRVDESGLSKLTVANALGVTRSSLYASFAAQNVSPQTVWNISKIINYNILSEVGESLPVNYETKREAELKKELETQKKEYELLKQKADMLEKIVMK